MDPKQFKNPDSILRPAPFWAINDRITPDETARQMGDMIDVGLSGGFFHSRAGLITDYLGEEWFAAMDAALAVAKKRDGYVWLYDEDLWPSGNAGGQVAAMKDEYREASLQAWVLAAGEPVPDLTEDQEIKYCYVLHELDGMNLVRYEAVPASKVGSATGSERLVIVRAYGNKTGWWGGESYANLLHPEAMREFVKMTHDVYAARIGSEFGKRVPGIFTDEPQITFREANIAWYDGLPDVYARWTGRDFAADLPFMFFNGPECRKVRLLVHRTVLRQFLESYSKPIFEWCEEHGIEHTGHYNAEDSLHHQLICHGGGVMSHYRYQQAPGIDHLCRQVEPMLLTCKQVASAARQLGRPRVLTEIFGVTRHTNTFEHFKWIGDYDLVMGANFFVPHLTWYSARGRRKRDYPPVWNYQQTYWHDLNPLNDYFTRVAHATTRGKAVVDVLMLHPIESAAASRRIGFKLPPSTSGGAGKVPLDPPDDDFSMVNRLDGYFRSALDAVLTSGRDCDLGDEGYIEDMGSVAGDTFVIGEMKYKVVVVPPSVTWRPKTTELVEKFVANGGKLIILGELPSEIDCEPARERWIELASKPNVILLPCATQEIQQAIDEAAPKRFSLKGADGRSSKLTYVQHRIDGDQQIIFIANSDNENGRDYVLTFPDCAGKALVRWDPVAGSCETAAARAQGRDLRYGFHLPPSGSLLVTLGGDVSGCVAEKPAPNLSGGTVVKLPDEFDFVRCEENVLVMDRMSVSFDGGKTFEPENLELRVRKGLAKRYDTQAALEWQPWVAIRKKLFDGKGGDIVLRYTFTSDLEKPRSYVVIEDLHKGELMVNGSPVDTSNAGWHWDRGFGKVEITEHVKKGENIVDFAVHYDFLTEVESAYIVGDFGVEMMDPFRGKIVSEPAKLKIGPWNDQGYPFYAGKMIYKAELPAVSGGRTFLRLIGPSGTLFKVRLNGENAGSLLWRPYEVEIKPKQGKNELEIEVVSSLQNAWGPLHEINGDDNLWCGPHAFEDENFLREEVNSFPYGLVGGVELIRL